MAPKSFITLEVKTIEHKSKEADRALAVRASRGTSGVSTADRTINMMEVQVDSLKMEIAKR